MSSRPEPLRVRLSRVLVPGTTGGVYTLFPGTLGFLVVLGLYAHSALTGRAMPDTTGELLTASVTLLGVHQLRGSLADRANAANGPWPVPVTEDVARRADALPDLRPREH